jgi:hypothetical protein
VEKNKPPIGDKAMSTSILYHTFGIRSVQHLRSDFLAAKRSFTAQSIPTKLFVHSAAAAM